MKIIVFGSTGRTGREFVTKAKAAGHDVTAFVRSAAKGDSLGVKVMVGDVRDYSSVKNAISSSDFDAIIVAIGEGALKPSTLVTEGTTNIARAATEANVKRYIAVSGSAEIADQTWTGRAYTALLRKTPVGHAIKDHDGAFEVIEKTSLDWTLVGCNYLADGPEQKKYKTSLTFEGGAKKIYPADVADFMLKEMTEKRFVRKVVGIWY